MPLTITDIGDYLHEAYLTTAYLADQIQANLGIQVRQSSNTQLGVQVEELLYNTNNLRWLCNFSSRGVSGSNWTASPVSTGADFLPKNLNTDILEQRYQSNAGVTTVTLICDTQIAQGVYADTFSFLEHNLSAGVAVEVTGSDDLSFSSPNIQFSWSMTDTNSYHILPSLPNASQSRYWRFVIQDQFNSDGYLAIGAILFGRSDLFSLDENFTNPIEFGYRHYKDTNPTEGFTSVSNDRAMRKFLTLRFSSIQVGLINYSKVIAMILESKTSLKCLIIPTPDNPGLFAVFAKLVEMPTFSHVKHSEGTDESAHYVDFDMRWDEAL